MINRLMAGLAFAVFLAFLGILLWFVPRLDLGIVIGLTVLLAGYDLYNSAGERD
ncbi:MAG: hypothetical protein U1D35_04530 [Paracoccaceae bacterium]|nr:hypothetical protein [Paracoccaceae bacterium]